MSPNVPPKWLVSGLTALLAALSISVLISKTYDTDGAAAAARGFFVLLCLLGLRYGSIREWLLAAVAASLALLMSNVDQSGAKLNEAGDLAAFFAAFIVLLTVLKVAAERSRSILAVGRFLTSQPPGRRYYATALGGHILGVFLNFGAVSLMAPLIQKGAITTGPKADPDLERRQLSALLRGFSWILLWAPTTLSQAVLLTLFTEVNLAQIFAMGLATALLMMVLGRIYDRFEWRTIPRPSEVHKKPVPPWPAIGIVFCVCFGLISSTVVLQVATGYSTALALMFVAPVVTLLWYALQSRTFSQTIQHLAGFPPLLAANATGLTRSAMALGLSGFIGRALADVLPIEELSNHVDLSVLPAWLFLACLPLLITLGGQIAISPIMLVVFLGQIIQTLPVLPAEPTHIVFALSAGWALSMLACPNATATLLISATSNIAPTTLTWRWNLRYALLCYAVFVGVFIVLAW